VEVRTRIGGCSGCCRRNSWLDDAMIQTEQVDNARIVIRAQARHGEQSLALALNLPGEPFALTNSAEVSSRASRRRARRGTTRMGGCRGVKPRPSPVPRGTFLPPS
jgi:hypothetical protein